DPPGARRLPGRGRGAGGQGGGRARRHPERRADGDGLARRRGAPRLDQRASAPARLTHASELTRRDQFNKDVPFFLLEDGGVLGFTDSNLIAIDDDFRTRGTRWAERMPFQALSPFASMCGQTAPTPDFVERQDLRMPRIAPSAAPRSSAFCSSNARTCAQGTAPDRLTRTISVISASVRPRRRAWPVRAATSPMSSP